MNANQRIQAVFKQKTTRLMFGYVTGLSEYGQYKPYHLALSWALNEAGTHIKINHPIQQSMQDSLHKRGVSITEAIYLSEMQKMSFLLLKIRLEA
ncbi:MAG: hypothetical protein AB8G77_02510 [Rhodothermales bacterium]